MVFTNLGDYKLNPTVFLNNGTCLYPEIVYPTMLRLPGRGIPLYAIEDKRAHHICTWEGHTNHNDEDDVFYVELNGIVLEFYHVTISVDFAGSHQMQAYSQSCLVHDDERFPVKVHTVNDTKRRNREQQVKLNGNFRAFANLCGFREGKLMRFKLVDTVVEVVEGEENEILVFHVC
ncbi:hypothetical protein CTI12_AA224420 [Artemisia annua]|uniref:DNA-binding pseudobarrel domain-containing protein n=1 Tax=Artemisia annua TaxID=35608 RepID=A0A2U1NVR9_ARTAN|nr:hypothetical protein CTI12_AA224420 [Artemisia annua]